MDDQLIAQQKEVERLAETEDLADLSSFQIPNNVLKKIGKLARESYDNHEANDLEGLSKAEWTLLEEVITGFENR